MPDADRTPARPAPTYPIASVDNALRLLGLFRDRQEIRLSEASSYLGVANSTAHRLLAMLVHHGFADQDTAARSYRPGPALIEVGAAAVRRLDLRSAARPVLERLAARSGETALLSRLDGARVLCLDAVESTRALRVAGQAELLLPAHCSAAGKALLARLPTDDLRALYPTGGALTGVTADSLRTVADLDAELTEVRRRGYAVTRGESEEGLGAIAAAALDGSGRAVGALSVSAPIFRLEGREPHLVEGVRHAAAELGSVLAGGSPGAGESRP